jgi:hypothetical protein
MGADRIQIQASQFTGTAMGAAGDLGGRGGQCVVHRRGRRQGLRLGQVPEQLVQRPHDREGGEHLAREGRRLPPVLPAERALDDVLPGPEAVVAGAAGKPARPKLIVNGTAEARVQVRARLAGSLVDGEVGGRGEPRRDAAQRCTPGAVGLQLRQLDILPALKDGDSSCAAHGALRWVAVSPGPARASPGLTDPPQPFMVSGCPPATLRPSRRMFLAAFTSRSWTVPHAAHAHSRTLSGFGPSRCPHAEHSWLDGNHRPTLVTARPYRSAFSSSSRTSMAHPASCTDFASLVRARPDTARSST